MKWFITSGILEYIHTLVVTVFFFKWGWPDIDKQSIHALAYKQRFPISLPKAMENINANRMETVDKKKKSHMPVIIVNTVNVKTKIILCYGLRFSFHSFVATEVSLLWYY